MIVVVIGLIAGIIGAVILQKIEATMEIEIAKETTACVIEVVHVIGNVEVEAIRN